MHPKGWKFSTLAPTAAVKKSVFGTTELLAIISVWIVFPNFTSQKSGVNHDKNV